MQLLVDLFSSLVSVALQHSVTKLDTQSKGKGEIHMNSNYVLNLTWQALKRSTTQFVKPQMCLFRDVDFVSNGFVFHFMCLLPCPQQHRWRLAGASAVPLLECTCGIGDELYFMSSLLCACAVIGGAQPPYCWRRHVALEYARQNLFCV